MHCPPLKGKECDCRSVGVTPGLVSIRRHVPRAPRTAGVPVTVQVMKTGLTPQLAPSDHLREAETEQLHPAEQLHTLR
jgi:hypothetical protein